LQKNDGSKPTFSHSSSSGVRLLKTFLEAGEGVVERAGVVFVCWGVEEEGGEGEEEALWGEGAESRGGGWCRFEGRWRGRAGVTAVTGLVRRTHF
jgi:hypothetical protein